MTKLLKCFLLLLCLPPLGAAAQDLRQYFKETEGCFTLYDLKADRYLRYNEERCRRRFSPFSTFKIPNLLIGLETGVIKDAEFVIPLEIKGNVYFFALNIEGANYLAVRDERINLTKRILTGLGYLPNRGGN